VKKIFTNSIRIFAIFFVALFLFSINVKSTEAATRTWTGTTSGSWSVASNWGGTAPVTGDDLVFPAGASNLSNTNDFTENTIFNSITISGSGYTLSGNPIILGAGLAGLTDSASSGGNTIALDIRLDVTRDIVVTNAAETLTISGRISGVGGINKEGLGKVVLSGANTFGGILKINVGVVNAQNNTALGTIAAGTEIVGGAALELQGGINISYEALALRGYGVSTSGALRNISENNTFRGLITLSSAGGAEIASDSGTLTLTGGTTGNFPLVLDGAGSITFSTAPIAGSGAVTKNGAGTVTLNFPNTNTGAWVINQGTVLYGVDNALMTNAITVTGGTLDIATFSDMVGTVTLGTLDLASGTITGSTGVLSSATWTLYNGTISAIIAGVAGTMTKSTTGTVTLTRPNLYTGATTVSLGILKIQNSTALGTIDGITTVTAGATLEIDGSGLSIPEYITFSGTGHLYTGAIRNKTGNNTLTGLLTLGTAGLIESDSGTTLTIDGKGLSAANIGLVIGGAGNVTFTENAPIYGSGATLTKNDTGTLTLQGFNNFTGATNLSRGEIVLNSSGALPNSAITIGSGGTLTIDNSTTSALNRLSETAALTMNGGTFNFIGSSSQDTSESTGALTLSSGHNVINISPGSGGSTTMTFASLSRTAGATALFKGTNFGSKAGSNISTLMFTTAPTLTGGGGAANSPTISIIKGVFGDTSLSGNGSDMVTYNVGNTNGIRLLNTVGFNGEYSGDLTIANSNVKLTADRTASTISLNSLILDGFNISNGSATITMASASLAGNILINSANSIAGANTTLGITTFELDVLATATSTISAIIGTATTGSLTLSGTGNITLSGASLYTGTTSINNATLTYGASNVLSTGGLTVIGGTYDIGNFSESLGAVILQNGTITGGSGVLTSTASYSFREGTVSAIIAGSVAVTRIATSAAADSVVTMTRDNTYTGATTITSGILRLGGAGGVTNTPLGTTGGSTTVANIAALDLNGYTLGTAEAISIAGLGYGLGSTVANGNSNMGAIMNTSNTPATYSGAITLTAAARINADAGALTISSAVSGAFGLTIGGFSNSTFSGVIGTGTGTITKDGIGSLTLSNSNTYTGATTVSSGTLKLGATGGATNTPLGTTGAGTTVSTGARLDLNGFTLGTAEGLTLNGVGYGLGDFASGALINSSGSAVSYSGAVTLGSTGVLIKADSGNITLSGAFSGATFALTIGGTGSGTISGVIGTTTGTVTKINTGTWTLSNSGSTYTGATTVNLGTLKLGVSGGATNTPLGTTGGGTSIMSGAVLDFNGFTVGTAEALTVNGRGINDGGAIVGANVTFAGTIAQATDSRITNASGTFTISGAATGAFALYVGGAGNITFSAATGTAGLSLVKQGAGTVTLTGTNTHTGETRVDAGTLAYAATTTLAATNLVVKGGTFNSGANADTIGTVTLIGGTITNSAALTGTAYTLESGTVSGILAGAVAVTKNTNNTVTLTGANTISSTITINAGTLTFSGGGTATSVTGVTVNLGGTLTLDNSTTGNTDRLSGTSNNIVITMNGGNLNFIGNSAGTSSETLGQLALASGHSVVTVTPGAGGSTTLTFGNNPGFNRTAGATVLFRGTSFGSTPAANVSTLMFSTAPTLTGGGGASNSTTISIIKGAFGDSSLSGTGSDMVTYNVGNTNGLRLLNGAGFAGEYATNLATTNANVKLSADAAASTVTTNSIILNGFSITNPGTAQTITLSTTGNILANSATSIAGANTTLGISTSELCVLATANATISAVIGSATTGSLTLSGSGNVTLSAANPYTSTTFVNGATFTYSASNVISSGGLTIVGGTVNLNGNSDTVGTISINAGTITTGAGTLTGNGTFSTVANNNVASIITGNLGLGANATFTINDGLMDNDALISAVISGGFTFAKAGNGVLELSGSNTYTGTTTISAGTLRLGAAGGVTNTPLGTTAGGTTVSGVSSALDLNGFTLGTSEALTLSGALATGALQNTSSTSVDYTGLITLGAASTIISNYGDINITNTGTITGATFGLTIGGAGNGTLSSILGTTSGTLTKNGLGVWTISGSSTFTGLTTVSAGTLKLGAAGGATNTPLGTTGGATSITSGAILDLNGFTLGTSEAVTINGTGIASIGAFINSSNNNISYTGAITMGAASRVANYGTGVTTLTGNISGNFALTVVAVGNFTQSTNSVWSGSGTLVKEGSGTLILAGQNTMTGAMTVSTGVLQLGASGGATNTPLGTNAGGVTVALGAVLDLSTFSLGGASTYETLNISGTGIKEGGAITSTASGANNFGAMTVTANATVENNGSGLITFGGTVTIANTINLGIGGTGPTTISGIFGATATTATINKWDSGILTISAASITTGLVRINGGTLKYGVADALSTPPVTVAGGTLNLNGFNETNLGALTLIDGSVVNTGAAATLTSTATYTLEKGTVSAVLGGTVVAVIAKNTAGKVILSGDNTFSGTSATIAVNAGYLNLQHSNALGAAASANTTTISGGATLELENSVTIPSVKAITANGTGMSRSGAIRSVSGTNSIGANVTLGTTNVRINSDSGTLTIPTISGNTFNLIFGGAGNTTVSGAISTTTGSLTKDGAGSLTLSGVNTYTGSTTAIAGTIVANSTSSIGDGSNANNTFIFRGGTLQATGTITSASTRAFSLATNAIIDTNGNSISIAGTVGSIGGLTVNGAGTLTLTGTTTIGGNLTIASGTFVAPTTMTVNGDFSNSGTFTHNNGSLTLTPTNSTLTTNILGSSNTTFYNLINTTPGSTVKLKAGNTYTFANVLTLTGVDGNPISINSDTPDSQWLMTLSGSSSISYLKVKDSGCSGGNSVGASSNIYNYGNNGPCWSFVTPTHGGGGGGYIEGSGALGTVVLTGNVVTGVIITNGGGGYSTPPTVKFCGGGGSGALGTAVLSSGSVSSVTIDNGGSGYSSSVTVVFGSNCPTTGGGGGGTGGSSSARATAVVSSNVVQSVTIDFGGSGYTSTPTVKFCGGGGSGALGTAVLTGDSVSSVTVDNGGSNYTSVPSVVFNSNCPTTGGGGGGGGDIGFLYDKKRMFALLDQSGLINIKSYFSKIFTSKFNYFK
jgi:autotransporter-associated beta strand protein